MPPPLNHKSTFASQVSKDCRADAAVRSIHDSSQLEGAKISLFDGIGLRRECYKKTSFSWTHELESSLLRRACASSSSALPRKVKIASPGLTCWFQCFS